MSNSSINSGSLAGVQAIILSDDSERAKKSTIRRNVVYIILSLIGFVSFSLIYYSWLKIPHRVYYFNAEQLASADSSTIFRAEFIINDPKILDSDHDFIESKNNDNHSSFNTDNILVNVKKYKETFMLTSLFAVQGSKPKLPYSIDNLKCIIGEQLFSELQDTCQANNIDLGIYSEVFFIDIWIMKHL